MKKIWLFASMRQCSLHHRDRALQVFLPRSRKLSPKLGSLLIEVTTKIIKLTESIKKVKKKRGGPSGGRRTPVHPVKSSGKKTFAGNQKVMSQGYEPSSPGGTTKPKRDYWAQYRNAQRTVLCAQGKFSNFLDRTGQQKSWCNAEDARKRRNLCQ